MQCRPGKLTTEEQRHTALHKKEEYFSRKGAKTQRREALPRFLRVSLRLCAFAREPVRHSSTFVQSRDTSEIANKEAHFSGKSS
jgi:hypothetical protein